MKNSSHRKVSPQGTQEIDRRALQLIYKLGKEHFKDLAAFSAWQLAIGRRHQGAARTLLLKEGPDLLHEAFETILAGLQNPHAGRHPRSRDVENMHTFIRYLRNVIRSIRYKHATSEARRAMVLVSAPVDEELRSATARLSPDEDPELRDLKAQLLTALRQELDDSKKYRTALEAWRTDFFTTERLVELGLNPKDAWKLRSKAQRIYLQLSEPSLRGPDIPGSELC